MNTKEDWINLIQLKCSSATVNAYRREIDRLEKHFSCDLLTLTTNDLIAYLAQRRVAGRSDSTLYRTANALKSFYEFMQGQENIARTLPLPKRKKRIQRTLMKDEARRLLFSFDTSSARGQRNLALSAFMLDTGFRAAEVCGFPMKQLDLSTRLCWTIVKGGQEEFGVFSEETAAYLATWFGVRERLAQCDQVFVALDTGKALTPDGLRCIFHRIGQEAGIPDLAPHVLRRSFATITSLFGAPARAAQEAGRWKRLEEYQQYTRAITLEAVRPFLPVSGIMRSAS